MAKTIDLILGSDHRGRDLKYEISDWLSGDDESGTLFNITTMWDCGTHKIDSCDYPDVVKKFAEYFDIYTHGILICGSGFGVSIAANRFPYIRANVCRTAQEVKAGRQHNDMNVLCIGADFTSYKQAQRLISTFISTEFEGGRHLRRVKKLGKIT